MRTARAELVGGRWASALIVAALTHGSAACGWRDPDYSKPTFSAPPADSLPPPYCRFGATDPDATPLPIAHVLREPGAYVGKRIRVRGHILMVFQQGYFVFAESLQLRLRFPDENPSLGESLSVRPTESSACGEAQVDIEGVLEIVATTVQLEVTSVQRAPDAPAAE